MELKQYIETVESVTIYQLEEQLTTMLKQLSYLLGAVNISVSDMNINQMAVKKHERMPAIFEEHKVTIAEKRLQFEEGLKVWQLS